jgi:hypothetical protein
MYIRCILVSVRGILSRCCLMLFAFILIHDLGWTWNQPSLPKKEEHQWSKPSWNGAPAAPRPPQLGDPTPVEFLALPFAPSDAMAGCTTSWVWCVSFNIFTWILGVSVYIYISTFETGTYVDFQCLTCKHILMLIAIRFSYIPQFWYEQTPNLHLSTHQTCCLPFGALSGWLWWSNKILWHHLKGGNRI